MNRYFLPFPLALGFFATLFAFFAGAFALAFGFAAFFSAPSGFSAFGFGAGLPLAFFDGAAPPVRISLMRISVKSWRWPRLRREFLRRRFLNAITFGPRLCSITSAATDAPET